MFINQCIHSRMLRSVMYALDIQTPSHSKIMYNPEFEFTDNDCQRSGGRFLGIIRRRNARGCNL